MNESIVKSVCLGRLRGKSLNLQKQIENKVIFIQKREILESENVHEDVNDFDDHLFVLNKITWSQDQAQQRIVQIIRLPGQVIISFIK